MGFYVKGIQEGLVNLSGVNIRAVHCLIWHLFYYE